LQPDHVRLLQHQFRRVLDSHDSLVGRDKQRETVEHRGLARAGTAADQDVEPRLHDGAQEIDNLRHQGFLFDQILDVETLASETTNRERRSVQRQRRYDRIDTRSVRQARIDHRRRFVNSAADLRHDSIDNQHQMLIVLELDVGCVQFAALFNVNLVMPIDQDIGYLIVPEQRLQRSEPEQLVLDFLDKMEAVGVGQQAAFILEDGGYRLGDFLRSERRLEALEAGNIERFEQPVVDRKLQLLKALRLRILDLFLS